MSIFTTVATRIVVYYYAVCNQINFLRLLGKIGSRNLRRRNSHRSRATRTPTPR